MSAGLLDTSVWIADEVGRTVALERLPDDIYVSVITVAELQAGVLAARDAVARSRRMATVHRLASVKSLSIDNEVAREWAVLRVQVAEAQRKVNVNDLWIAATAKAHRLPVITQDADFTVLSEMGVLEVIRV